MSKWTPEYRKEYDKKRYQRIKPERCRQVILNSKRLKKWYLELKESMSCSMCPEKHPACLQFHHIDPSSKRDEVSNMVKQGLSKKTILEEIDKCAVLCANCHMKHHFNN